MSRLCRVFLGFCAGGAVVASLKGVASALGLQTQRSAGTISIDNIRLNAR